MLMGGGGVPTGQKFCKSKNPSKIEKFLRSDLDLPANFLMGRGGGHSRSHVTDRHYWQYKSCFSWLKTQIWPRIEQIEHFQNHVLTFCLLMPTGDFSPQYIVQCIVQITWERSLGIFSPFEVLFRAIVSYHRFQIQCMVGQKYDCFQCLYRVLLKSTCAFCAFFLTSCFFICFFVLFLALKCFFFLILGK